MLNIAAIRRWTVYKYIHGQFTQFAYRKWPLDEIHTKPNTNFNNRERTIYSHVCTLEHHRKWKYLGTETKGTDTA